VTILSPGLICISLLLSSFFPFIRSSSPDLSPFPHPAGFFLVTGAGQMWAWAVKKHIQYKKDFGTSYPKRKVMFPFLF